jgi:hypothetical protein
VSERPNECIVLVGAGDATAHGLESTPKRLHTTIIRVAADEQRVHSRRRIASTMESPLSAPRSLGGEIGFLRCPGSGSVPSPVGCDAGPWPETGRSRTGRSSPASGRDPQPRSASVSTDGATCSDCGPAPAVRAPNSSMSVLTDIRNRGTRDVFFLVCDGLKDLPEVALERTAGDHGSDLHRASDRQTRSDSHHVKTGMHSSMTLSRFT